MKRDFEKYFTQLQLQYNRLQKDLEKINKEIADGLVTDEQKNNFMNYFTAVKTNYDRLAYARYLYRLPHPIIQKLQSKYETYLMKKELKKYEREHADQKSVLAENEEYLKKIDEGLEECKNS